MSHRNSERGDSEIAVIVGIIIVVFLGAFWMFSEGAKADLEKCKRNYGQEYVVGNSTANSSIKWCQAPNGEMKAL